MRQKHEKPAMMRNSAHDPLEKMSKTKGEE